MSTCDDYQLAYEMQLHGATPSIAIADVTAHVTSCPSCSAYVDATRKAQTMNTTRWLHREPIDTELVRARMTKDLARLRLQTWSLLPAVAVLIAVLAWQRLPARDVALVAVSMAFALALGARRYFAMAGVVGQARGDVVAARRAQLDKRLARSRRVWVLPLMPVVFVLPPLLSGGISALERMMQPLFFIASAGFVLTAALTWLQRRRDLRERRALDE